MPLLHHIAQVNIARTVAPLDDPRLTTFLMRVDAVNALADAAPGFVWRFQADPSNAALHPYGDERILVNLSVWQSIEHWHAFVYRGGHLAAMRRRADWFEPHTDVYSALWWVPAGHRPSPAEATERLDHLRGHGDSPYAFTFAKRFPPPAD